MSVQARMGAGSRAPMARWAAVTAPHPGATTRAEAAPSPSPSAPPENDDPWVTGYYAGWYWDQGYEPDEIDILDELLPRNLAVQIFRALLENAASEQGARMTAMDNATRNAGDMIRRQTITYNRTRQAMITKELIEIISGAEAL